MWPRVISTQAAASNRSQNSVEADHRVICRAERESSLAELPADLDRELGEPSAEARTWADEELRRTGLIP